MSRPLLIPLLLSALGASAQITTDGRLGAKTSLAGPDVTIDAALGRRAGANLFHSFSRFNVNTGQSVTFDAPAPVSRVLARVTGNQPSRIEGLLRCPVDLWLMNPRGVAFSGGASLDVSGAFVVTTADVIRMQDGTEFRSAPRGSEVLTTASPASFGFLSPKPGAITVAGDQNVPVTLGGAFAKRLALVAGGVRIESGRLLAKSGRIEVVAAAPGASVELEHPSGPRVSGELADISLTASSEIDGDLAGRIFLRGRDILLSRSSIHSRTDEPAGGGLIDLGATGAVTLDQASSINANTLGDGRAADLRIHADSLRMTSLSVLSSDSGDTQHPASGAGGDLTVNTGDLRIDKASTIQSFVWGSGNGGHIRVTASRSLTIDGANSLGTGIASESRTPATTGNGGPITLVGGRIILLDTAQVTSTTRGQGNAGALTISAQELILDGHGLPTEPTLIQSRAGTAATGSGATVTLTISGTAQLLGGGVISASTFGRGDGGNVNLRAGTLLIRHAPAAQFTGAFARSAAVEGSPASGFGRAGNLTLAATDSILLRDGAQISALAEQADGGSVSLSAARGIDLTTGSSITAQAGLDNRHRPLAVDGGNLTLNAVRYLHLDRSTLSAKADRNGGDLMIDPQVVALAQSNLLANAIAGFGGSIDLFATEGLFNDRSTFNVSSRLGVQFSGSVNLFTPDIDLGATLARLPGSLATPDMRLRDICGMRFTQSSTFLIQGRGALTIEPGGALPALSVPTDR